MSGVETFMTRPVVFKLNLACPLLLRIEHVVQRSY